MKAKRMLWVVLSILLVSSMLFVACKPKATEEVEESTEEEVEETETEGTFYERAMAGEFDGKVVTINGPFTDEDAVKFDNSVAAFEEATGIDIQYEGSKEFEATISVRVEAGDPPDIVDFPQPGLLKTFVAQGEVVDLTNVLPQSSFDNYLESWWDMATMAGPDGSIIAGVWHRFNAKSQVWYPKDDFEAAGYEIPETWEEMLALSDQIVADGDKPWCVGIESGAATGWPATDWMEEVMLRTTSLENYDKWTTGELPFSSPEVKHALEVLDELWADEYVYGGSEAIVTTFFGDAPAPMFEDPPKCWLHKQGNFITSFFPEGAEAGTDYDFFYLPPIDEEYGKPYLVAGDIMAMFNDRPEVRAVMEFFTKGECIKEWLAAGGALSPHLDAELDWYGDDIERGIAGLVAEATSVRFDGSDLMPGEVGAGSFWTGMTDYFSGTADMDTVMEEIDASWPAGGEEPVEEEETISGTIKFWHALTEGEIAGFNTALADFQSMYPDIEFDILYVPFDDLQGKFETAASTGGGPDLLIGAADWGPSFFNADLIADVSGYFEADFLDTINQPALGAVSYSDALIGLPFGLKGVVMYRNASIIPEPAASFDDLVTAAQEATEGDVLGANLEAGFFFSAAHLNGVGGSLMNEAGDPAFNDDKGVEWLTMVNSFQDAGPVEYYTDNDVNLFQTGTLGIVIDGTWNLSAMAEAIGEENLKVDPWPEGMSGYVQNDNLYMNANVDEANVAAALAFAEYLESPEAQALIAEGNAGFIPNVAGVEIPDRLRQEAVIAFKGGTAFPVIPEMGAYWGPMDTALQSVLNEGADPAEVLQTAYDAIVDAIAEIRGE